MAKKYGLSYQGSKSKLADWIIDLIPPATHLYDLFAGGCAVTHAAILSGKFEHVHANDITDSAKFFYDVIEGKYAGRNEWICREDFFRLKDSDPWVRHVYSFSCDQRTYLYGKEIEPYKKALHGLLTATDQQTLRLRYKAVIRAATRLVDEQRERAAVDAEFMERMERLESLQALEYTSDFTCSQGDYRDVVIQPDSVVYCDIPYRGTRNYRGMKFDYAAFYEWALRQTVPVFISEYSMPSDFECVAEFERTCSFSATNNALKKVERIYRPKHQL